MERKNSTLCGSVCDFGGRVRENGHQQNGLPALLGQCEPVVSEFGDSDKPG